MVARYLKNSSVLMILVWLAWGSVAWAADSIPPAGSALPSKTVFYRNLARKPSATIEDAIRALARFKGGTQEIKPLVEELAQLEQNGIRLPKDIVKKKDMTMTMGSAAHMLMKALGVKGKSFMYIFFPDQQRYALREATDLGIVPPNTFPGQTLSGNDLMGLLVRVNDISEKQKAKGASSDAEAK